MKKEQARQLVLDEMRRLLPEIPYKNPTGGFEYFSQLQIERPDLFEFRSPGDKWQVVHGWMLKAGLVTH